MSIVIPSKVRKSTKRGSRINQTESGVVRFNFRSGIVSFNNTAVENLLRNENGEVTTAGLDNKYSIAFPEQRGEDGVVMWVYDAGKEGYKLSKRNDVWILSPRSALTAFIGQYPVFKDQNVEFSIGTQAVEFEEGYVGFPVYTNNN